MIFMSISAAHATEIWRAGVAAVTGDTLIQCEVKVDRESLTIGNHRWRKSDFDRILVVGAGKANSALAIGLLNLLEDWLPIDGWMNVPAGTEQSLPAIHLHPARPAGVNEPTAAGVVGAERILQLVRQADSRTLCIAIFSGGGSALLPAPIAGITLADKLQVTRCLSDAGADIRELNTVRKQLSQIKGGGLLRACRGGQLVTLLLSDVLGDPLDMIASGPTILDTTTPRDALQVLQKYDRQQRLPDRVYAVLQNKISETDRRGLDVRTPVAPLCPSTTIVLGNNARAVDECGIKAESLGYNHAMHSATGSEGSAESVGHRLAEMLIKMLRADPRQHRINCLITGGEPTVVLAPIEQRGVGGRNQQLVLAAYQLLQSAALSETHWQRLALLSGGTDGEDGPTDAAGAVLDGDVHRRARQLGLDIQDHLRRNDAYTFFAACGGLLKTGPTGTNVCDIRVAVVQPA
jgi:glycerate-2-kinase